MMVMVIVMSVAMVVVMVMLVVTMMMADGHQPPPYHHHHYSSSPTPRPSLHITVISISITVQHPSPSLTPTPHQAPVSGYAFGKGVYFADMFQKSYGYCRGGYDHHSYMLLCEVALGNMQELMDAKFMDGPDAGFQSVLGRGYQGPDWNKSIGMLVMVVM